MKIKLSKILIAILCPLLIAGCAGSPQAVKPINFEASVPPGLQFSKKGYKVICLLINKKDRTMSTLYGNDIALSAAKAGTQDNAPGLEMALITWKQKPNPYWFGNNIPGYVLSVEMVTAEKSSGKYAYTFFAGQTSRSDSGINEQDRLKYILAQKPSVFP